MPLKHEVLFLLVPGPKIELHAIWHRGRVRHLQSLQKSANANRQQITVC